MNKKSLLMLPALLVLALLITNCSKAASTAVENQSSGTINTGEDKNIGDLTNGSDDVDGDGILNVDDNDIDGDGILNENDPDMDGDGIPNIDDNDIDGDGIANEEDPDMDGDGIPNTEDPDMDGDGILNVDDNDMDGDGIPNTEDPDMDGDGIPNEEDPDMDGDGIRNEIDNDVDGDGVNNNVDPDIDGDDIPNELDDDVDGDNIPNDQDDTPSGHVGGDGDGIPVRSTENDTIFIDFAPASANFQGTEELDFADFRQRVEDEGGDLTTVALEELTITVAENNKAFLNNNSTVQAQMNIYYDYQGSGYTMIMRTGLLDGSGDLQPIFLGDIAAGITMSGDMAQTDDYSGFMSVLHDPESEQATFLVEVIVGSGVSGSETIEFHVKIDAVADKAF